MKTATLVKELKGWKGDARLYRLSEPVRGPGEWGKDGTGPERDYNLVVVSAVVPYFGGGPETFIFPALNEDGEMANMLELEGSFQGGLDHERALLNAGYEVVLGSVSISNPGDK